jgi:hypothetical protein
LTAFRATFPSFYPSGYRGNARVRSCHPDEVVGQLSRNSSPMTGLLETSFTARGRSRPWCWLSGMHLADRSDIRKASPWAGLGKRGPSEHQNDLSNVRLPHETLLGRGDRS